MPRRFAAGAHSRGVELPVLPESLRAERTEPLRRILRKLPDPILEALVDGLDRADQLVPGQLYADGSGGCAVGVIMRAIFPAEASRRVRWWNRRRHVSLYRSHPQLAREFPHLVTLESVFDRTIELAQQLYPELSQAELGAVCGRWMAAEAATELGFRHLVALEHDVLENPIEAAPREQRRLVAA
jgi:hypothetical protein